MNFRRILSKSSLRSSSSSGKTIPRSEEISKLHSEIESYKQTIESLKVSLESRDAAIGTLAREKEKLYVELKSAQRTNRNLHQQVADERDIHSKEKEYLNEEIKRLTKIYGYEGTDKQDTCADEQQSNYSIKEELKAKDEVICNICSKYLKIKSSKKRLQRKFERFEQQSQKTCENIILLLQENRRTLESLLTKLIKTSTVSPKSKKYLRLLKINAALHYENTQLKVCLSQKDLPDTIGREQSNKEDKLFKRVSKSEAKLNKSSKSNTQVRLHTLNSRHCGRNHEMFSNFKRLHGSCSPFFRRMIYYHSNSDPCLTRF